MGLQSVTYNQKSKYNFVFCGETFPYDLYSSEKGEEKGLEKERV